MIHITIFLATIDWIKQMAITYQKKGIKNTLAVNWTSIATQNYLKAASAVKSLGQLVAEWVFYKLLHNNTSALKNLHLVGHSLGAQVSGFVGKSVYNKSGSLLGRISGKNNQAIKNWTFKYQYFSSV